MNREELLKQLVWIGIGLSAASMILVFVQVGVAHGSLPDAVFYAVVTLLSIGLLVKIGQHRNWARRLFILLSVLSLPLIPFALVVSQRILFQSVLGITQWSANTLEILFGLALFVVLFIPSVRALFTSERPKGGHRVVLAALAIPSLAVSVLGFMSADRIWRFALRNAPEGSPAALESERLEDLERSRQEPRRNEEIWASFLSEKAQRELEPLSERRRSQAETLLGIRIPRWGLVHSVKDRQGVKAVTLIDARLKQLILLFLMEDPSHDLGSLLEAAGWEALYPNLFKKRPLEMAGRVLESELISLLTDRRELEGVTLLVQVKGKPLVLLTYADGLYEQGLRDFLEQLLRLNPT